jgi:hypothetical protein
MEHGVKAKARKRRRNLLGKSAGRRSVLIAVRAAYGALQLRPQRLPQSATQKVKLKLYTTSLKLRLGMVSSSASRQSLFEQIISFSSV